jgi:hypothetical protein
MDASGRQRWFPMVILFSLVYLVIGIAFGEFARWATSNQMRVTWNRLAFLTSAVAFAVHIGYEHFRLGNSLRITASHVSIAVALGAFALALVANIHDLGSASGYRPRMLIALVAWPVLTAVPAFIVALVAAVGLNLRRKNT